MSAAQLAAPAPDTTPVHEQPAPGGLRVVLALAWAETRRLLRHPLVVLGAAASLALAASGFAGTAAVLDRDSVVLVGTLLPLAAAVMLAAHGLATRHRRARTTELLDSLPTRGVTRVAGEAIAGIGPILVALALLAAGMAYLAVGEPIGSWQWLELAIAPAMVAFAHMLGIVLGQWLPSRVTPVVVLVGMFYLHAWAHPHVGADITPLLSALAPYHALDEWVPYAWQLRAPAAELAWLLGITGVLLLAALLRHERTRALVTTGVLVLAVAVVAGSAAVGVVDDRPAMRAQMERGADHEHLVAARDGDVCVRADDSVGVQADDLVLCALPGFEDWIPRWHDTVRRVEAVLPSGVELVRQTGGSFALDDLHREVTVGMHWDRPGRGARHAFELAVQVATRSMIVAGSGPGGAVGGARTQAGAEEPMDHCWLGGEARAAVALWIAVQSDDRMAAELRRRTEQARGQQMIEVMEDGTQRVLQVTSLHLGPQSLWSGLGAPDGDLALAMLDLPEERVRAVVLDDPARWADPTVGSDELSAELGLPAPEQETDEMPFSQRCA